MRKIITTHFPFLRAFPREVVWVGWGKHWENEEEEKCYFVTGAHKITYIFFPLVCCHPLVWICHIMYSFLAACVQHVLTLSTKTAQLCCPLQQKAFINSHITACFFCNDSTFSRIWQKWHPQINSSWPISACMFIKVFTFALMSKMK